MKKVPLVIYPGGKRKVIGEAVVHDSGAIEGKVTKEVLDMDLDAALQLGIVFKGQAVSAT